MAAMIVDHVVQLVADAAVAERDLRERFGLGCLRGMYHPPSGTRHHIVPLTPPQILEVLTIEDRDAAGRTDAGRSTLACAARGFGVFSWCTLVDDLEAVSDRLGIEIVDYTLAQPDGTLRGWRTVSGAPHLPFFIDYPNNGDRTGRLRAMYERAEHTSAPTTITSLTIRGSKDEHDAWLGPNDLPLRFVEGQTGIREARIATAFVEVTIC